MDVMQETPTPETGPFASFDEAKADLRESEAWISYQEKQSARDRQAGTVGETYSHGRGTCGGHASLCASCSEDEMKALMEWAEANLPPRRPDEDPGSYARRVYLPMFDAWYRVAKAMGAEE